MPTGQGLAQPSLRNASMRVCPCRMPGRAFRRSERRFRLRQCGPAAGCSWRDSVVRGLSGVGWSGESIFQRTLCMWVKMATMVRTPRGLLAFHAAGFETLEHELVHLLIEGKYARRRLGESGPGSGLRVVTISCSRPMISLRGRPHFAGAQRFVVAECMVRRVNAREKFWMKKSLRKCIRPVSGEEPPGHDEIRRVPVLQNASAVEEPFEQTGVRYAVLTVLSSSLVQCRPGWESLMSMVALGYAGTGS